MANILIIGNSFKTLREYLNDNGHSYRVLKDKRLVKDQSKALKHWTLCNFSTKESIIQAVEECRTDFPIEAVMVTYENYIVPAAYISKHLGLPGLPVESALACTDKYLMRQMFVNAAVKISPDFAVITNENELREFAEKHTFPLILKPANLAKSLLVTKNDSLQDLLYNYQKAMRNIDAIYQKFAPQRTPKLIIEEYMSGTIHSVDAFVDTQGQPHVLDAVVDYETGYDIGYADNFHYSRLLPSKLTAETIAEIRKTAEIGCRALGIKNSPAHIEIILTEDGPRIVEIGARNGGYRERMHGVANGIDITGNAIRLALGLPPQINETKSEPMGVFELFPKSPGIFRGVHNERQLEQLPSLIYLNIKAKTGNFVGSSSDGYKMCAIVILHNPDKATFDQDRKFLQNEVYVSTDPAGQSAVTSA